MHGRMKSSNKVAPRELRLLDMVLQTQDGDCQLCDSSYLALYDTAVKNEISFRGQSLFESL
jgi:hypothetical protein